MVQWLIFGLAISFPVAVTAGVTKSNLWLTGVLMSFGLVFGGIGGMVTSAMDSGRDDE